MIDTRVWLLWAVTILALASSIRNPLYVIILLLIVTVVGGACNPDRERGAIFLPLRFAATTIPLAALFNGLTVHLGDATLFHLPDWLPLMGGAVTLEALIFGATNGLILTAIFGGFTVFNQVTPARDLMKLTPRAFHEAGVVLSIALNFIPQTSRSLKHIREAQEVRGHRVQGLRDWLPIVVPLLVSGLERSMKLAEAMVARGYGGTSDEELPLRNQALLALGLAALLLGWLGHLFHIAWPAAAWGLVAVGAALIAGVVWSASRSVSHTVYRERRWAVHDTLAALGCGLTLVVALTQQEALYYSPYPHLTWPVFDPLVGLGILGLLAPAILTAQAGSRQKKVASNR